MTFRLPLQISRNISQCKTVLSENSSCKLNCYGANLQKAEIIKKCIETPKPDCITVHNNSGYFEHISNCNINPSSHNESRNYSSSFFFDKLTPIPKTTPTSLVYLQKRCYQTDDTGKKNREKIRKEHDCHEKQPEEKLIFRQTVKEECTEYAGTIKPDKCPELQIPKQRYDPNKLKWKHICEDEFCEEPPPRMDNVAGYKFKRNKLPKIADFHGCKETQVAPKKKPARIRPPKKLYDPTKLKWIHDCAQGECEVPPPRMDAGLKMTRRKLPNFKTSSCEKGEALQYTDAAALQRPKKAYDDTKLDWRCTSPTEEDTCNYDPPRMDDVKCWKPKKKKLPSFNNDTQERSYSTNSNMMPISIKENNASCRKRSDKTLESIQAIAKQTNNIIRYSNKSYPQLTGKLFSTNKYIESRRYYSKKCPAEDTKDKDCKDKKKKKEKCPKFTMPGCKPPVRTSCESKIEEVKCTKIEPPYPSFGETNPQLPEREITECDMAEIATKKCRAKARGDNDDQDIKRRKAQEECKKKLLKTTCILGKHKKIPTGCPEGSAKSCKSESVPKPTKAACVCDPSPKSNSSDPCSSGSKASSDVCKDSSKTKDPCSSTSKKSACNVKPSGVLCKGSENTCEAVEQSKSSPCTSKISASARSYTGCPCDGDDAPKPKPPTLWQRFCNYFRARPNCPAPDDWKKQKLREKAYKAAAAAGLEICDPKSPCDDPCKAMSKPKPNPCAPVCSDPCKKAKKKRSLFNCKCIPFGKKSKCFSTFTVAKREYGTCFAMFDDTTTHRRKQDSYANILKGLNSSRISHLFENLYLNSLIFYIYKFAPKQNTISKEISSNKYLPENNRTSTNKEKY